MAEIGVSTFISMLIELYGEEGMQELVKSSLQAGLCAGAGAAAGAVIAGPLGVIFGGTIGSAAGYYLTASQEMKPLKDVLNSLSPARQKALKERIINLLIVEGGYIVAQQQINVWLQNNQQLKPKILNDINKFINQK